MIIERLYRVIVFLNVINQEAVHDDVVIFVPFVVIKLENYSLTLHARFYLIKNSHHVLVTL